MKNWQTRLSVNPDTQEMRIVGKGAMSGKIPTFEEPTHAEGVHPLFTGSISDSVATREALEPYYDALLKGRNILKEALIETQSPDFNQYRPEVADLKRYEKLKPALEEIDKTISKHIEKAQKGIDYAQNMAQAARELVEPKDEIAALRADLNAQEIRRAVESMLPNERKEFINAAVDRQDMFSLNALSDSYLPVIKNDPHYIDKAIDHVVSERFPFVTKVASYNGEIMKAVQTRTQEFRFTMRQLISQYGLDLEKLQRRAKAAA